MFSDNAKPPSLHRANNCRSPLRRVVLQAMSSWILTVSLIHFEIVPVDLCVNFGVVGPPSVVVCN